MSEALIGYTGFVGGAILRHHTFDSRYRSTDIGTIQGRRFDRIVCAGAPAEKWKANRDPAEDRRRLATLTGALAGAETNQFVLISTVDVYPAPARVDENTVIDPALAHPYGRHRYELEQFCRSRFDAVVIRLPALFGQGLKKNAVFDLLNDRPVDAIAGNARFQFYDVERVWSDVERILTAGHSTVNITSQPVSMADVAARVFDRELPVPWSDTAPNYDVRSVHADLVGGTDGYWFDAEAVIDGMRRFVAHEKNR
jgi:nucleoside-diphosphate-sugar epimerase